METKEIIQIALIALVVYIIMTCISHVKEGFNRYASLSGANNLVLTDADGNLSSIQFPKGMIMIWKGSVNNVPQGWALCDGTKDTPDLRGRFVLGANPTDWPVAKDSSLSVNQLEQKGGKEEHSLTIEEMPKHSHSYIHQTMRVNAGSEGFAGNNDDVLHLPNTQTGLKGGPAGSPEVEGLGKPHNNMPPYYVLAYIMKM
jgi:microcystin-dependent protein